MKKSGNDRFIPLFDKLDVNNANISLNRRIKYANSPYAKQLERVLKVGENRKVIPIGSCDENSEALSPNNSLRNVQRTLPTLPERVLDAPNLLDDFYLNIMDWSNMDILAIALSNSIFLWNATSRSASCLANYPTQIYISSLQFSSNLLAVGDCTGKMDIWDVEVGKKIKSMNLESECRFPVIAWNQSRRHTLSVGSKSGKIHHVDLKSPRKIATTMLHTKKFVD